MSRNSHLIKHCFEGTQCDKKPLTKNERLFKELIDKCSGGGVIIYKPVRK